MNLLFLIVFIVCLDLTYQAAWTYDGEESWPGVCAAGGQQSPIDISTGNAVLDRHQAHIRGPLSYRGYGDVQVGGINNGHTLKWSFLPEAEEAPPVLSGGPLRGNYSFLQFHLHWLSEHSVDGLKYPLEIHLVHVKTGLTVEEALERHDGLAVIGILCELHGEEESNFALEQIIPQVPSLLYQNDEQPIFAQRIDITRLFSPEPQSYFTYAGSLTTPNCQEVVTWIVMDKPLKISDTQYKLFSKVNIGGPYNYRRQHASSDRVVYRSAPSCSAVVLPGLLHFLTSAGLLLSCALHVLSKAVGSVNKYLCPMLNWKKKLLGVPLKDCAMVTR